MRALLPILLLTASFLPPPQGEAPPAPAPEAQLVPLNRTVLDLLRRQGESQGGHERLQELRVVAFELGLASHVDGAFVDQPPLAVHLERGAAPRRARIDDVFEGRKVVKLANEREIRVFVDGRITELADLVKGAELEVALLSETIEFVLGLSQGRVAVVDEGQKRRDGKLYHALRVRMRDGLATERVLVAYLDLPTGLVERIDVFEAKTGLRVETARLRGYPEGPGPKLPAEVHLTNREDKPISRWTLRSVRMNPEVPEGLWEQP